MAGVVHGGLEAGGVISPRREFEEGTGKRVVRGERGRIISTTWGRLKMT